MRTTFTAEDMKLIIGNIFASDDEDMIVTSAIDGEQERKKVRDYLNVDFYTWKNRVVGEESFDVWQKSIDVSLNKAYGLVEVTDASAVASQDIDSGSVTAKVTVIIQADKAAILDYFVTKLRNAYLGNPQEITNAAGQTIKAFINIGAPLYDSEPSMTQFGECIIVSFSFIMSYLADAMSYVDEQISISLDGSNYLPMPYTAATWQKICTTKPVSTTGRPDLTGFISSAVSSVLTITYYDMKNSACDALRPIFARFCAKTIGGTPTTEGAVHVPIYVKNYTDNVEYVYNMIIDNMQRSVQNGNFTVCSITLKGNGKL